MKISQMTGDQIAEFLRLDGIEDESDRKKLEDQRDMAIRYICTYTGQNVEYVNEHEEMTHAVLIITQDMHDNRSYCVENDKVNVVAQSIMDLHRVLKV